MRTLVFRALGVALALKHDDFFAMRQPATPGEVVDFRVKVYQLAMATLGEKNTRAAWCTLGSSLDDGHSNEPVRTESRLHHHEISKFTDRI